MAPILSVKGESGNWVDIPAIKGDAGDSGVYVGSDTPPESASVWVNPTGDASPLWPIGSVYVGVNDVNPCVYFGGTWERWGNGAAIVGVDEAQTEFAEVEQTGGAKTHTLATEEMPAHNHGTSMWVVGTGVAQYRVAYATSGGRVVIYPDTSASNVVTTSTGSDSAHNNLQPYITCYMWKRIA